MRLRARTSRLTTDDPSGQLSAAWALKGLRQLLQAHGPTHCSRHETTSATRFLTARVVADGRETTRLATTIER